MILAPEACGCPLSDAGVSIINSTVCTGTILFMMLLESYLYGRCAINDPCNTVSSVDNVNYEYDFIVVGAGPAGSVVAARLSEHGNKVLLLEAGGEAPMGANVPSFYRTFWYNEQINWRYRTVPDNYCLDQYGAGCYWPRGKALGGSNILNGMMYHRGHPQDYQNWVNAGAVGWSWKENFKYFLRSEGNKQIGQLVSPQYHSSSGPVPIQRFRYSPPMVKDLLRAINETGEPIISDMNDLSTPNGFTIAQAMNDNGQRYTAARAYLKPKNKNLSVKLRAHVTKVLINSKDEKDKKVYGVEFVDKHGIKKTVYAKKEVILSAGSLNTPQILMLSGIGPKRTLEKHNIKLLADLPVGLNLRNHYGFTVYFLLSNLTNTEALDWNAVTEYLLRLDGPMSATGITQVSGLIYSSLANRSLRQPDLQFFFNGLYAECSRTGEIGELVPCAQNGLNISMNGACLLPRSVGYLTLNSTDPFDPPVFYPNYFDHPDDMIMIKDAAKFLKKLSETDTFKNKYGMKLDPSWSGVCDAIAKQWSDKWLECYIRQHTDPQNHQLGTVAMGQVVDPELKVYGIRKLRVADASVMPRQVTGNPQAAIMMVGERAASFILNDWK